MIKKIHLSVSLIVLILNSWEKTSNNNIKVHLTEPEIIFLHADLQQYLSQSCGAFVCMAAQEVIEQRESNSDSAPIRY